MVSILSNVFLEVKDMDSDESDNNELLSVVSELLSPIKNASEMLPVLAQSTSLPKY